jgi:hypothetical protein
MKSFKQQVEEEANKFCSFGTHTNISHKLLYIKGANFAAMLIVEMLRSNETVYMSIPAVCDWLQKEIEREE